MARVGRGEGKQGAMAEEVGVNVGKHLLPSLPLLPLCSSSSFSTTRRVSGLGAGGRRCGKKRSKEEKEEEKISTFSVGFLLI
jgi:hypothetical protein